MFKDRSAYHVPIWHASQRAYVSIPFLIILECFSFVVTPTEPLGSANETTLSCPPELLLFTLHIILSSSAILIESRKSSFHPQQDEKNAKLKKMDKIFNGFSCLSQFVLLSNYLERILIFPLTVPICLIWSGLWLCASLKICRSWLSLSHSLTPCCLPRDG